jgi:hypothetical protein
MNAFVLDLWHDLKQKRLWPVAVAMLAAIAVVPVMLSKPVADPGEPAPAPAADTGQAAQIPLVDLESVPASSSLDTFSAQNPFSPDKDKPEPLASTSGSSESGSTGGTTASAGGGTGDAGSAGSTGGSSGDTGSTGGGSGDTGSTTGGGKEFFTFQVDLKFGPAGEEKKRENVKALDVLPDEQNPVVVFMGVKDDGKTALFMVLDPGLQASGEGKCEPSKDDCSFFELTTKDSKDEMLLDSSRGQDYGVQLTRVTRVEIDAPAAEPKAEGARSSRKEKDDVEPFFLPHLIQRAMGVDAP